MPFASRVSCYARPLISAADQSFTSGSKLATRLSRYLRSAVAPVSVRLIAASVVIVRRDRDQLLLLEKAYVPRDRRERHSKLQGIATIPEFIWELSFCVYLIVKGFKPTPTLAGTDSEPDARGAGS
jgi:hypothetical protein